MAEPDPSQNRSHISGRAWSRIIGDSVQHYLMLDRVRMIARTIFLCGVVGLVAGLGAALFFFLLDSCRHYVLDGVAGFRPGMPGGEVPLLGETDTPFSLAWLAVLPVIGGLISGVLVYATAPEAEGHGTDAAIDSYHHKQGFVRARIPPIKTIASAITIGFGGSAGREGPIAQIGAGFASVLGRALNLDAHERRILMVAGMGAGIGSIFHAPLAGALFSAEVLYKEMDFEYEVIIPSIIASITAYSVFSWIFGWSSLFVTPNFNFESPVELLSYALLAVVVAIAGSGFVVVFGKVQKVFRAFPVPNHIKPAIGGALTGLIALLIPEALSSSYGVLQQSFLGQASIGLLLAVAIGKIFTTSFTIGSGGSGGVFGPAVVIGGSLGGALGLWLHSVAPAMASAPGAFAVVGMAGFFAAVANTPISTVIMVSEMTGNYHLLVPSMWVCTISFLLARRFTIYEAQVETRADAPHHLVEMVRAMLQRVRVRDVYRPQQPDRAFWLTRQTPLHGVLENFSEIASTCLPVVEEDGTVCGAVHLEELQKIIGDENALNNVLIAGDLLVPVGEVSLDQSIEEALHIMAETRYSTVLVSQDETGASIVGSISASDINAVYDEMASEHRHLLEKTGLALPDDTGDSVQLKLEVEACHKGLCFKKIRDIQVPDQCLIAILRRAGRAVIPRGDTTVEPGDTLIMLTVREREQALRDWIHEVGVCLD